MTSFIVWVGGIDDHYQTHAEALEAAARWREEGHDDVQVETEEQAAERWAAEFGG